MSISLGMQHGGKGVFGRKNRKWVYGALAVVIVLGTGATVAAKELTQSGAATYPTYTVGYGNVVQTVSAAATVQPATTVNLSFDGGGTGTLATVNVSIGQKVTAGQVLATLDDTQETTQVAQDQAAVTAAQGNLEQAQAKLLATQEGPTAATIAVAQAAVARANATLAGAKQQYQDEVAIYNNRSSAQQQLVSAQNAVAQDQVAVQAAQVNLQKTQLAAQASLDGGGTPQDVTALQAIVSTDEQAVTSAQKQLALAKTNLQLLSQDLSTAQTQYGSITQAQVEQAYQAYQSELASYNQFVGETTNPEAANPFSSAMQAADTEYQQLNTGYTDLQQAQEQYNAGEETVQNDQTAIANAQSNLATAQKNVADAMPASSTNLAEQSQVSVQAAQVSLTEAQTQYKSAQQDLQVAQALYNDRTSGAQAVSQAQNTVEQDQIAVQSAQASLQETEQPSTPAVIEESQAAVTTAQAQLSSAQAALQGANVSEADMTLRAPMSGVITAINDTAGELVNGSAPVMTLQSDTKNQMELNIQVPEAGIGSVKAGDQIQTTVSALPNQTFTGTVLQVYPTPQVVDNVTNYTVMAVVNDPTDQLLSGMATSVSIQTATANHVVEIPAIALQQVGTMEGVYVVGTRPAGTFAFGAHGSFSGTATTSGYGGYGSDGGYGGGHGKKKGKSGSYGKGFGANGTSPSSTNAAGSGIAVGGANSTGGATGSGAGNAGKFGAFKGFAGSSAPKGTYFQPVQVGIFGTNNVQITAGLKPNEKIVLIAPASATSSTSTPSFKGGHGGFGGGGFGGGGFGGGRG